MNGKIEGETIEKIIAKIIIRRNPVAAAFYLKTIKLLISLSKRNGGQYLTPSSIKRTLSSLKLDKTLIKHMLSDLNACGLITFVPRQGYQINKAVIATDELPYSPRKDL